MHSAGNHIFILLHSHQQLSYKVHHKYMHSSAILKRINCPLWNAHIRMNAWMDECTYTYAWCLLRLASTMPCIFLVLFIYFGLVGYIATCTVNVCNCMFTRYSFAVLARYKLYTMVYISLTCLDRMARLFIIGCCVWAMMHFKGVCVQVTRPFSDTFHWVCR